MVRGVKMNSIIIRIFIFKLRKKRKRKDMHLDVYH